MFVPAGHQRDRCRHCPQRRHCRRQRRNQSHHLLRADDLRGHADRDRYGFPEEAGPVDRRDLLRAADRDGDDLLYGDGAGAVLQRGNQRRSLGLAPQRDGDYAPVVQLSGGQLPPSDSE